MAVSITEQVQVNNAASSIDELYGPYTALEAALEVIPAAFLNQDAFVGRTIGIYNDEGKVVDYKYQKSVDASGATTYAFEEVTGGISQGALDEIIEAIEEVGESINEVNDKIGEPDVSGETVFSQLEGITSSIGKEDDDKTKPTIFGRLKSIIEGGTGGGGDSKWSKWLAQYFGNPEGLPAEYEQLTDDECEDIVDTLASQIMHSNEDGEVDYLYALQMAYPDHTFTEEEMASIKDAQDEYWRQHPLDV